MHVEHVARIRLATRRAAQQQRELAIRDRLLREIVVDDQRVLAVVAEPLAHRAAGVGRDELQRRRLARRGGDHDRVLHRAELGELLDHLRDGRLLLPGRDVDAEHVETLLVDDRVERDRRLAGLPVADDQLALAAADRRHRVDRLDPGLQRLVHRFTGHDARRLQLDAPRLRRVDGTLAVDRPAERIDHAAEQTHADRHLDDAVGAAHDVAFANVLVLAHDRDADVVLFEVQHHPAHAARELDEFAGHGLVEPVDARDAVADREHGAGLRDVDLATVFPDLALQNVGDLSRLDVERHLSSFSRELRAELRELGAQTAVEYQVADPGHQAA